MTYDPEKQPIVEAYLFGMGGGVWKGMGSPPELGGLMAPSSLSLINSTLFLSMESTV